jgi:hypothetical protein
VSKIPLSRSRIPAVALCPNMKKIAAMTPIIDAVNDMELGFIPARGECETIDLTTL